MLQTTDIPVLNHIRTQIKLPEQIFISSKRAKKQSLYYRMLSSLYSNKITICKRNLLLTENTLTNLTEYFDSHNECNFDELMPSDEVITSLTVQNENDLYTYLIILRIHENATLINVLKYHDLNIRGWLGGVYKANSKFHTSINYLLDESESSKLFEIAWLILRLLNFKDFEKVFCKSHFHEGKPGAGKSGSSDLILVNMSAVREYYIPTTPRREHYRWQYCGEGRSVLKRIKVRSTIVKSHKRRGNRIQ